MYFFQAKPLAFLAPWLLALGACTSVPSPAPTALQVPPAFKHAAVQEPGVWQPAQAAQAPEQPWWQVYADPVLHQLQDAAHSANPSIAQSLARLQAAQAALGAGRAGLLPTVGANASAARARSSAGSAGTSTSTTNANANANTGSISESAAWGLSASWELDLWGRVAAQVQAAQASVQASAADVAAARLSVQASLAQSYFALRSSEAQERLLAQTLQAYERSLELTRHRQHAGVASHADVLQAQAQLLSTQAQHSSVQTQRAQLEHALAALVGQAPATFTLAPTAHLAEVPPTPASLPSTLLQRRPDIAAAQQRVAAANAQVGAAQAAFFPSITLSAQAGYRATAVSQVLNAPSLVWSLGPALAASLFDGGARSAAVDAARAAQEQAASAYRQSVLTALQEVEDSLVAASALQREQDWLTQAVAAAEKALAIATHQYRAGTVGYLNVLTAQNQVLAAQRSLLAVQTQRLSASVVLHKNLAGGWRMQG